MSRYARTIIVVLTVVVASTTTAVEHSDLYVIPIAGHVRGAGGTAWRSDVVLHNLQRVPIAVEMALVESGLSASVQAMPVTFGTETAIRLAPGETRVISDVLENVGRDVAGALIVGSTMPFVVTSRTYSERLVRVPTLGQTVSPIAISGGADAVNDVAVLAGLAQDESKRANVGVFVAASHVPFVAEIELVSASGGSVGSRLVVVDDEGFAHEQFSAALISPESEGISVVVRILEGDGILVPYGSIIDNETAEAMFVPAGATTSRGSAARAMLSRAVVRESSE